MTTVIEITTEEWVELPTTEDAMELLTPVLKAASAILKEEWELDPLDIGMGGYL